MFLATLAHRPPIATNFLAAIPAAIINEVIEVLAGFGNRPVPPLALVQVLLPDILAGNPAQLALVCV